jgi:hypothetical protein
MAWIDGRFQMSYRMFGVVETRSYGRGEYANLMWNAHRVIRWKRELVRIERQEFANQRRKEWETEKRRAAGIRDLVTITLDGLGFRLHARNRWRRKRMKALTIDTQPPPLPSRNDLRRLIGEVRNGVQGARGELHRLAVAYPEVIVEATYTDLASLATETLANHVGGDDACTEGVKAKMRMLYAELVGDHASPAIRLVTKAVVFAWLEHWILSLSASTRVQQTSDMHLRRQNAAHRRFIRAVKTYSQIAALDRFVSVK